MEEEELKQQKAVKPCKFAVRFEDGWICTCWRHTYCADQLHEVDGDTETGVVWCGYAERRTVEGFD